MKYLFLFITLFLTTNLIATQELTLEFCIDKALKNHPEIQRGSLGVQSAQSGVSVVKADYLPHVTLAAEYDQTRTFALPVNGIFNTKESDAWALGGILNQKVWDFSKTTANIAAQEIEQEIAELTLTEAKALLAYKVKLQYEMMLVQKVAIDIRENDVSYKTELYKQAEAFVKNGMRTNAEATRFLSSLYEAKEHLSIAQAAFEKARTILSLYIGEEIAGDVRLQNSLEFGGDALLNEQNLSFDEQSLLQNAPTLLATQKSMQKSELLHKVTKATHYGSVDAVASYTRQNTLNEYDATLFGITYNVPLYSGGRTEALVEQAQLAHQSAVASLNAKTLALKEEFSILIIDLERYKKTIKAKESQLEAARQTQRVLEARYKEGLATYIEVLDASALTLNAKLGLIQAIYERSSTLHKLEYLQGKSL